MNIAIVSLTYNRTSSLKRQLSSLEKAYYSENVDLIISIDNSGSTEVEDFAESYKWQHGGKRIIKHEKRLGTRRHVMSLSKLFDTYEALVVLEDDITVAPSFMLYADACVKKYSSDSRIAGISLYNFNINYQEDLPFFPVKSQWDVYFMNCAQSWGEVWMKEQWIEFKNWYDNNSGSFNIDSLPRCLNEWPDKSWLKYHTRYCIEKDKYFVYPYYSLSTNNAEPGVNQRIADSLYQSEMLLGKQEVFRLPTLDDCEIKYDGFFNPKFLSKSLNIDKDNLTIDLYGNVPKVNYRRFVLSTKQLPYTIKKSFSIELHPMEVNVIMNREGEELWLYDTSKNDEVKRKSNGYSLYYYYYRKAFFKLKSMVGFKGVAKIVVKNLISKLKRI